MDAVAGVGRYYRDYLLDRGRVRGVAELIWCETMLAPFVEWVNGSLQRACGRMAALASRSHGVRSLVVLPGPRTRGSVGLAKPGWRNGRTSPLGPIATPHCFGRSMACEDGDAVSCSFALGFRRRRETRRPLTVAWPRYEAVDFGLRLFFGRELLARCLGFILVANDFLLARIWLSDAAGPACRMPGA